MRNAIVEVVVEFRVKTADGKEYAMRERASVGTGEDAFEVAPFASQFLKDKVLMGIMGGS